MSTYDFFWNTMELCDWKYEGDDDRVLLPVIEYLAKQGDDAIFQFDDIMLELLCQLDTEKLAEQCEEMKSKRLDTLVPGLHFWQPIVPLHT